MSEHSPTAEIEINVSGMDCPSCAEKIEKVVSRMEGVESVALNFTGGKMTVRLAEETTTVREIERQVQKLGYQTGGPAGEGVLVSGGNSDPAIGGELVQWGES